MSPIEPSPVRHDTPYTSAELAIAMLRGGRPLLHLGHLPGLPGYADMLGCPVVGLVTAAEPCEVLVDAGHEAHLVHLDDPEALGPLGDRLFEQILVLSVLETAADPVGLLRAVTKHLTPEGHLILSVRNAAHVDTALSVFLGRSPRPPADSGAIMHLHDRDSLEALLAGAGLTIIDTVEVHRGPSIDTGQHDTGLEATVIAALERASTVYEWVVVASLIPHEPITTPMRRWLLDAIERSRVIAEASAYARSLEDRAAQAGHDAALETEQLAGEIERLGAEIASLRAELDDALVLEREVEWQRELIATQGMRLDAAERRLPEVEQAYASAMAHAGVIAAELEATRQRAGFVLMDRLARRAHRSRLLSGLVLKPAAAIVKRRG